MRFPNIPTDVKGSMQRYLRDLSSLLDNEFKRRVPNTEGTSEFILVSPSRKVYSVRVDDLGNLSATLVKE